MWVTGTFIAEWIGRSKSADYRLVPDNKSIQQLPHFAFKDAPKARSYEVLSIEIENGPDALRMAAGSEKAERLLSKKAKTIKATGSFLIRKYRVGVECDNYWARAEISKAKIPDPNKIARIAVPESC